MLTDYYFNKLGPVEQVAYNALRAALSNRDATCTISGVPSSDDAHRILNAVVLDHPEFIHYPGLICIPLPTGADFRFNFQYTDVDTAAYDDKLNELLNKINGKMSSTASDYDACKTIYDELASTIEYENEVLRQYLSLEQSNAGGMRDFVQKYSASFTPYGVLLNRKGVCMGIAKLFKIICDRFGLQCACVEAKTPDLPSYSPNNHLLNVVEIDGVRAFVDVTDGIPLNGLPIVMYDKFLVPHRVISKTLVVSDEFDCNSEALTYFAANKLCFTSVHDLRVFLASYVRSSTKGEIRCQYDGKLLTDQQLQNMFFEIINDHCPDGYTMQHCNVKNGFCTGLITSDEEN